MKEAEERAKELIEKFLSYAHSDWDEHSGYDEKSRKENAIECAIICVDEILSIQLVKNGFWQVVKEKLMQDEKEKRK